MQDLFRSWSISILAEMNFHTNDSQNKVVDHYKEASIHFEYTNFWDKDEETFRSAKNMTTLKKRFKQKITTMGEKGKIAEKTKTLEEEEAKKRQEDARRLAKEAESWLKSEEEERKRAVEEVARKEEEERKRNKEVEIKKNRMKVKF